MKKKPEDLEKWLRETAQSAEMKDLVEEAESAELSEELLLRYHAGLLTPEEEEAVAPLIALNKNNLRFLAGIEADIQAATDLTKPPVSVLARLAAWGSELVAFWRSPYHALRFVGGIAVLILVAMLIGLPGGPPGPEASLYRSPLIESSRGAEDTPSVTLPDGTKLERVDLDWPLIQPTDEVENVEWFMWSPLSGKDSYNFRLYSPDGKIIHERTGFSKPYVKLRWIKRRSLEVGEQYTWVVETAGDPESKVIRGVEKFRMVRP